VVGLKDAPPGFCAWPPQVKTIKEATDVQLDFGEKFHNECGIMHGNIYL